MTQEKKLKEMNADALFGNHQAQGDVEKAAIEKLEICIAMNLGPDADWQDALGPLVRTTSSPAWLKRNKVVTQAILQIPVNDDKKVQSQAIIAMMADGRLNQPFPMTAEILKAMGEEVVKQYEAHLEDRQAKREKKEAAEEKLRNQQVPQKREKEADTNPIRDGLDLYGPQEFNLTVELRGAIGADRDHATREGLKVWQALSPEEVETLTMMIAQPAGTPLNKIAIVGPGTTAHGRLYEFALKVACEYADQKYGEKLERPLLIAGLGGAVNGAEVIAKYRKKEVSQTPMTPRRFQTVTPAPGTPEQATTVVNPSPQPPQRVVGPPRPGTCLTCGLKHPTAECQMDLATLSCLTCHQFGHGSGICPQRRF